MISIVCLLTIVCLVWRENSSFAQINERAVWAAETKNTQLTREQAKELLEKWLESPDGNNGEATAYPEYDKTINDVKYYYFEVAFGYGPAAEFYVDCVNGYIYSTSIAFDNFNPLEDKPLNK